MKTAEEILSQYQEYSVIVGGESTYRSIEAVSAMEAYAEQFKPVWIKIKDQLPEMHQDILLFDGNGPNQTIRYTVGSLEKDNIGYAWQTWDVLSDFEQFTHWMPLPEPPKE